MTTTRETIETSPLRNVEARTCRKCPAAIPSGVYCDPCLDGTTEPAAPAAPFAVGQRVRRHKLDNAAGEVVGVQQASADYAAEYGTQWFIAVRLDQDGETWSGSETAWCDEADTGEADTAEPEADLATELAERMATALAAQQRAGYLAGRYTAGAGDDTTARAELDRAELLATAGCQAAWRAFYNLASK